LHNSNGEHRCLVLALQYTFAIYCADLNIVAEVIKKDSQIEFHAKTPEAEMYKSQILIEMGKLELIAECYLNN